MSAGALLLTPGAGSDRNQSSLVAIEAAVAPLPVARVDFPYRRQGRKAPDRAPKLVAAVVEEAAALVQQARIRPSRLVLGGRSMGGRYCSMAVGDPVDPLTALGLLLLGYPLHPAGKPDQLRVEHFPRLNLPVFFISGDRDALAEKTALEQWAGTIPGQVLFHWIAGGDHSFRVPKSLGGGAALVMTEVAAAALGWMATLPS